MSAGCVCCNFDSLPSDIRTVWPDGMHYFQTKDLVEALTDRFPERWSDSSHFGRDLTAQRLGRALAGIYGVRSKRDHTAHRGYCLSDIEAIA